MQTLNRISLVTKHTMVAAIMMGASVWADSKDYMVIDISGGQAAAHWPVTFLCDVPEDGWADEFKTGKIVLRLVKAGTFVRQRCTAEEAWRKEKNSPPHEVVVGHSFYMGVFEITQRQYEHVTGMRPSRFSSDEGWQKRPVENVTYDDIRGRCEGALYPKSRNVDAMSFMGILRARTGLQGIDLPTEDIWEYCCRAGGVGTTLDEIGKYDLISRYPKDKGQNTKPLDVGSLMPNAIGIYDMNGNVQEWCCDCIGDKEPTEIPLGKLGCARIIKGGHYDTLPELCHPSLAMSECSSFCESTIGFRICCY